ncbi:helix-turn-helix transcriptional regulator [Amycolatopsis sp. BJA-103]|uniref:helix-turn-helix transcriptional regulator n=1 Tax=Amycolatopsis sp. BJA-103 TaxID=1911175 RepID=UPI000C774AC0|nr:helix-turn-helix transcriptional regulator [Amycolatopsis sp. BJA-103]AUI56803.1 hypothetical protein BKN51_00295 [Amycolatopsis sp. BJA-103]PNE13446.1 hypothetical protein B1H26_40165 [Amycolatopsis sp. BJA-103]
MSKSSTSNEHALVAIANMRRIRRQRGISTQKLADQITAKGVQISRSTIVNQETRRSETASMTIDQAIGLCRVLDITLDDLIDPALCETCHGGPPSGFTCNTCGRRSRRTNRAVENAVERLVDSDPPPADLAARVIERRNET